MLIDLTSCFTLIDGKTQTMYTMGEWLGAQLGAKADGISAVKAYDWAKQAAQQKQLNLDREDSDLLIRYLEGLAAEPQFRAPIILLIRDAQSTSV